MKIIKNTEKKINIIIRKKKKKIKHSQIGSPQQVSTALPLSFISLVFQHHRLQVPQQLLQQTRTTPSTSSIACGANNSSTIKSDVFEDPTRPLLSKTDLIGFKFPDPLRPNKPIKSLKSDFEV